MGLPPKLRLGHIQSRYLAAATVEILVRIMQGVAGFSDRKISHQPICVAPTDLRCLQSNLAVEGKCPAEICGLSNHNTESVRARVDLDPLPLHGVYHFHSHGP
jgi:hypothetical protein